MDESSARDFDGVISALRRVDHRHERSSSGVDVGRVADGDQHRGHPGRTVVAGGPAGPGSGQAGELCGQPPATRHRRRGLRTVLRGLSAGDHLERSGYRLDRRWDRDPRDGRPVGGWFELDGRPIPARLLPDVAAPTRTRAALRIVECEHLGLGPGELDGPRDRARGHALPERPVRLGVESRDDPGRELGEGLLRGQCRAERALPGDALAAPHRRPVGQLLAEPGHALAGAGHRDRAGQPADDDPGVGGGGRGLEQVLRPRRHPRRLEPDRRRRRDPIGAERRRPSGDLGLP